MSVRAVLGFWPAPTAGVYTEPSPDHASNERLLNRPLFALMLVNSGLSANLTTLISLPARDRVVKTLLADKT